MKISRFNAAGFRSATGPGPLAPDIVRSPMTPPLPGTARRPNHDSSAIASDTFSGTLYDTVKARVLSSASRNAALLAARSNRADGA